MAGKKGGQGIAQWPETERPRERLLTQGPQTLYQCPTPGHSPSSRSSRIFSRTSWDGYPGSTRRCGRTCAMRNRRTLRGSRCGGGQSGAIEGSLELGKRALAGPLTKGTKITSSRDLFTHYHPTLRDLRHEIFKVVLLDAKHAIMRDATVSEGSLTLSIVHPREVFTLAVKESAAAVIFCTTIPAVILRLAKKIVS